MQGKEIIYERERKTRVKTIFEQNISLSKHDVCNSASEEMSRHSLIIKSSDGGVIQPSWAVVEPQADQHSDLAYVICKMISHL